MENTLDSLIKQREILQNEIIKVSTSDWRSDKGILKALELNNQLIELLINKPVQTTNEQPKLTDLESNWLQFELEARNQQYGYEPNDIKIRDSIFRKFGLMV